MAKGADVQAEDGHYQALYAFGYDEQHPALDRGEVIRLGGHVNDQKMIGLRYLAPVEPGTTLAACGHCDRLFIDEYARARHGEVWHSSRCPFCETEVPKRGDRTQWIINHRSRCDAIRAARERERTEHLQVVKAIKAGA